MSISIDVLLLQVAKEPDQSNASYLAFAWATTCIDDGVINVVVDSTNL